METCHNLIRALPFEWALFEFMRNALLGILLAAPLMAWLGCLVINNQMAFFSEAIGHATLTGIAIGILLGLGSPMAAMLGFSLFLAVAVTLLRRYSRVATDTIISLVMSFTVALGVVLLSRGGGFARFTGFLVGDILTVTGVELAWMAVVAVVVLILGSVVFNRYLVVTLNRSLALSRDQPALLIEMVFAALVALTVTAAIPWIGLLVINSMLILPAATARNLARNMRQYVALAIGCGLTAGVVGLVGSYYWSTAAGATIVLCAMALFIVSLVIRNTRRRPRAAN